MRSDIASVINLEIKSLMYNGDGSEQTGNFKSAMSYVPIRWIRSDIQKMLRDSSGWRKPTAYSSQYTFQQPGFISALWQATGERYTYEDHLTPDWYGLPPIPGYSTSLHSVLVYRALAAVKDEKINLAVSLAEIGEVVKMITSNLLKIRRAYNLAKRGKWAEAYSVLGIRSKFKAGARDLSAGWLEMIYGWLPLLGDIHGAISEVNRKVQEEGYVIVGRAKSVSDDTVSSAPVQRYVFGWIRLTGVQGIYQVTHTQKVALWYRLDMPSLQRAAAVGILNPLTLVWELLPLSHLADWVSTVGDWLSSLDATIGLTYLGGTHTYHARVVQTGCMYSVWSPYGGKLLRETRKDGVYHHERMERKVITDSPPEKLVATNPFSTSHAITASALLITSLKSK